MFFTYHHSNRLMGNALSCSEAADAFVNSSVVSVNISLNSQVFVDPVL